MIIKTILF